MYSRIHTELVVGPFRSVNRTLGTNGLEQSFPNLFQVGTTFMSECSTDHFYQSECSTDRPTLVPFESKLFKILNYSV
jgi:hypothetical protein